MPHEKRRTVSNPLNDEDHKLIRTLKGRLADLIPLMERMERCGMPCEDNKAMGDRLLSFLDNVEAEFFGSTVPQQ